MPNAGEQYTATLLVQTYDASTRADLVVLRPDGTTQAPTPQTSDGGQTWNAQIGLDLAGTWLLTWTVTGTGARTEATEIGVGPAPGPDPAARIYATTTDLANFLRSAPPPGAWGLLEQASRKMDTVLLTSVYAADPVTGLPTDPAQRQAVAEATCAIVEWWGETGDILGAEGDWTSASAGGVSLSRDPGSTAQVGGQRIPWKAWNVLTAAKLLPGVIYQR